MKNKTYANMCRATAMIAEKGYDWDKANEIAIQVFEQAKVSRNGMSIEWYISKIATVGPAAGVWSNWDYTIEKEERQEIMTDKELILEIFNMKQARILPPL